MKTITPQMRARIAQALRDEADEIERGIRARIHVYNLDDGWGEEDGLPDEEDFEVYLDENGYRSDIVYAEWGVFVSMQSARMTRRGKKCPSCKGYECKYQWIDYHVYNEPEDPGVDDEKCERCMEDE